MNSKLELKNNFNTKLNDLQENISKLIDLYENDIGSISIRNTIIDISNALDIYNETLLKIDNNTIGNYYSSKDILSIIIPKIYYLS